MRGSCHHPRATAVRTAVARERRGHRPNDPESEGASERATRQNSNSSLLQLLTAMRAAARKERPSAAPVACHIRPPAAPTCTCTSRIPDSFSLAGGGGGLLYWMKHDGLRPGEGSTPGMIFFVILSMISTENSKGVFDMVRTESYSRYYRYRTVR